MAFVMVWWGASVEYDLFAFITLHMLYAIDHDRYVIYYHMPAGRAPSMLVDPA